METTQMIMNHQHIYLDGTIMYNFGTKIVKKFDNVPFFGYVQYYDEVNKWYHIRYTDRDEEDLSHNKIIGLINERERLEGKETVTHQAEVGQTNFHGELLPEKDSKAFGDEFPEYTSDDHSIITFQNTGQQPKTIYENKGRQTSKAFRESKANLEMYAEISIDECHIAENEKFNDRMRIFNPKSLSIVSSNRTIEKSETPWNLVGGTAITLDEGFVLHLTTQGKGRDITGLGRWSWV